MEKNTGIHPICSLITHIMLVNELFIAANQLSLTFLRLLLHALRINICYNTIIEEENGWDDNDNDEVVVMVNTVEQ